MNKKLWGMFAFACVFLLTFGAINLLAQEVKEKPAMYSYVSSWEFPRAQWPDVEKSAAGTNALMQKAMSSGMIVGYGNDKNLLHGGDGFTHYDWWSSMSMAGLLNVLDQLSAPDPLNNISTKHRDDIYVSHYYNWRPGAVKGYGSGSMYRLKADAPDDAVATLSKSLVAPLLEKMLSEGTISEYEIDTEAYHTDAPGAFMIYYIAPNADGIDKVNAAIRATLKAEPLSGPAFESMVNSKDHRDFLVRTNATYK